MLRVILPPDTENTFILSLGHCWTTLHSHKNQPYAPNKTDVCYHILIIHQVCRDVDRCVKSWSCSLSSLKWKVNGQYWWDILLSQQMLDVIKRFVDNNIICLSATQLMHAPVHGVCNIVQQLLRKTLSFISPELQPPTGQRWTQLITRFRESISATISVSSQRNWRNQAATSWTLEKQ